MKKLLALVAGVLGLVMLALPAGAWSNGLSVTSKVTATTAVGTCTNGVQQYKVNLDVSVKNVETGYLAYVTGVGYTATPSAKVSVTDNGGLSNGTTVKAGPSVTTYHVTLLVSTTCDATSGSIVAKVTANWSCADPTNYVYSAPPASYLPSTTGVPAVEMAGIGLGVVALGGAFVVLQHRSRRSNASERSA